MHRHRPEVIFLLIRSCEITACRLSDNITAPYLSQQLETHQLLDQLFLLRMTYAKTKTKCPVSAAARQTNCFKITHLPTKTQSGSSRRLILELVQSFGMRVKFTLINQTALTNVDKFHWSSTVKIC